MDDSPRVIEILETKISHQERVIAELSHEIYECSLRVERLEKTTRDMATKLKELSDASGSPAPGDSRPPHW